MLSGISASGEEAGKSDRHTKEEWTMACTTILVGKKASYDGSTMIARNDDSGSGHFTGGKTTAIGLNIETMPTHIAGMPCAVNINCHVTRHKTEVI